MLRKHENTRRRRRTPHYTVRPCDRYDQATTLLLALAVVRCIVNTGGLTVRARLLCVYHSLCSANNNFAVPPFLCYREFFMGHDVINLIH